MHRETSAELLQAGFRHGFFGRRGGVSTGPFASLNLAASAGDDPELVRTNRRRVEDALGLREGALYFLSQVHGTDALEVTGTEPFDAFVTREGDATFSTTSDVGCGVRSADCGTILIGDRARGSALAIHAGWRGTVLGVVERGLQALFDRGSRAADLVAATGPMIERCCFEVGEDVAREIASSAPSASDVIDRAHDKPHVDLRRVIHAKLHLLGVENVERVGGCTMCNADDYFSFRRDGKVSGRMVAVIVSS